VKPAPLALALLWLAPASASAQTNEVSLFNQAKTAYDAANYDEAIRLFGPLVDGGARQLSSHVLLQESRKYYGASLALVGRGGDATQAFQALLRDDPEEELSESLFPPRVLDVFRTVKTDMQAELHRQEEAIRQAEERQRQEQEDRLRAEILSKAVLFERTVERRPIWQGLVPFGIAQFQNGEDTKGALFLVGEGLLLAINIASYLTWQSLPAVEPGEAPIDDTIQDVSFYANLASLGGLVTLFGLGAWDGIANLQRERVTSHRLSPEQVRQAIEAGEERER
jgi:tetratricopeptide (TPR) repeat protein